MKAAEYFAQQELEHDAWLNAARTTPATNTGQPMVPAGDPKSPVSMMDALDRNVHSAVNAAAAGLMAQRERAYALMATAPAAGMADKAAHEGVVIDVTPGAVERDSK